MSLHQTALDAFGGMDILVNNAGILRDRTIFNMEESDWDAVIAVHLKGHYCASRPFANYIRAGNRTNCRIINFSSVSGLYGNFGQANYGGRQGRHRRFLQGARAGARQVRLHGEHHLARRAHPDDHSAAGKPGRIGGRRRDGTESGPQHIAPMVAWLATDEAAGITVRDLPHRVRRRGHHAAAEGDQAVQEGAQGVWTLDELDGVVPQLLEARKANVAAADTAGEPTIV